MSRTRPTFYLVPVTRQLSEAVVTGQYPPSETVVSMCVTIAGHSRHVSEGMEGIPYRKVALQRFLAFRTLAKTHWEAILDGIPVWSPTARTSQLTPAAKVRAHANSLRCSVLFISFYAYFAACSSYLE
ncbi:hypothetical protein C8R45DRAFT_1091338 [Mycena sanguinolenta]|nr:hypothetical protein C8R45DRAFT_1091338 [Mycena sanguinolenta]